MTMIYENGSVQELTLAPRQLNLPTAILQQAVSAPMESASPQAVSAHIPESYSSPCETGTFFSWQECPLLGRIGGDQLGIRAQGCPRPALHGADHAVAVDVLRVLVVRDKNSWFARGIEIDYSASGATLEDVLRHFERGFALTIQAHLEKFQTLSRFLKWAPTEVIDEYEAGKESFEVRMVTICKTSPIPRSFPYEHLKFSFPPEEAVA